MEILVSGREVLAEEALRIGMVNRLFSDDTLIEDTLSWVKEVVT
ncbi:MAG: hypothetical protein JRF71_05300 [Deltaproteobacteria bacterium]|nr:hypothetical protein [Deltaproteobacteria bacterium]MBW2200236.1 hypothetical protein [Deltaproteobacteria bacterium]MBW2538934.1 hypothetical protein [Deltaproteobacteria bacterium]